jgi:hypothetical protein
MTDLFGKTLYLFAMTSMGIFLATVGGACRSSASC